MSAKRCAGLAAVAVLAVMAVGSQAEARDRFGWRFPRIYAPHIPMYLFDDEYDADTAYYDDEEDTYVVRRKPVKRQRDTWWLDENSDLDPVYDGPDSERAVQPKKVKKKPVVKKAQAKPVMKPAAKVASISTSKVVEPQKASLITGSTKPVVTSTTGPVKTASLSKPAPVAGKSIGCTAGAAIITGYGFGQVKPKACTGETYAYDAARDGKGYLIKLSAASGEILDVKKVP